MRALIKQINILNFNNWKSNSDTETLLSSISLIGLDETLNKVRGMFAFSLFDKKVIIIF